MEYAKTRNANILFEKLQNLPSLRVPLPPSNFKHAWYKFYAYVKKDYLSTDWSRDRIISEINQKGFPAFSGSCSEIYLEKCIKDIGYIQNKRLKVAKELGESSLMFLVHPTIDEEVMQIYAEIVKEVFLKAQK